MLATLGYINIVAAATKEQKTKNNRKTAFCRGSDDIDVAQGCELASYPGEVLVEGIALRQQRYNNKEMIV